MKDHKTIYKEYYNLHSDGDYKGCEIPWCGHKIEEVHHIDARGMGGTTHEFEIEELMGMCTKHHRQYGDRTIWKVWLKMIHLLDMISHKHKSRYQGIIN